MVKNSPENAPNSKFFCQVAERAHICSVSSQSGVVAVASNTVAWVPLASREAIGFAVHGGKKWERLKNYDRLLLKAGVEGLHVSAGDVSDFFPASHGHMLFHLPPELTINRGGARWVFRLTGGKRAGEKGEISVQSRHAIISGGGVSLEAEVTESSFPLRFSLDPWVASILSAFAAGSGHFSLEFYSGAMGPFVARSGGSGLLFSSKVGLL